jgi:transcriptional regulator with XRE-family HTH domain
MNQIFDIEGIKEARKYLGKSQEDIANKLSISSSAYSLIENGHRKLSIQKAAIICVELNIDTELIILPNAADRETVAIQLENHIKEYDFKYYEQVIKKQKPTMRLEEVINPKHIRMLKLLASALESNFPVFMQDILEAGLIAFLNNSEYHDISGLSPERLMKIEDQRELLKIAKEIHARRHRYTSYGEMKFDLEGTVRSYLLYQLDELIIES